MIARCGAALISVLLLAGCDRLEDFAERPVAAVVISPQQTQSSRPVPSLDNPRVLAFSANMPAYYDQLQRCRSVTKAVGEAASRRYEDLAARALQTHSVNGRIDIDPAVVASYEHKQKNAMGACLKQKGYIMLD